MPKNTMTALFIVATVVCSACGAGDDSTAAAEPREPVTTLPASTDLPVTTVPPTTTPTTTAPPTTTPSTTVPPTTAPPTTVPPTTEASAPETAPTEPPAGAEPERVCLGDPPDDTRCWIELDASPAGPAPLIVDLHGYTMTAEIQMHAFPIDDVARSEQLVAVWPDSPDMSWNSGICCGPALAENRDDVGFVAAVIEHLVANGSVDPSHVYLTGFSNGCSLAQRIAVERRDQIAAVACFSDYLEVEPPDVLVGVPILLIHGTSDQIVPYEAGPGFVGALENAANWARLNQCAPTPEVVEDDRLVTYRYADCARDAEVVQMTVIEGEHGRFFGVLPVGTLWNFLDRH